MLFLVYIANLDSEALMWFTGGSGVVTEAAKLTFDFDRVYKGAGIARQLFAELTEPVLRQFLNGFNATVISSTPHPPPPSSRGFLQFP